VKIHPQWVVTPGKQTTTNKELLLLQRNTVLVNYKEELVNAIIVTFGT
jgi:hypothetical protein